MEFMKRVETENKYFATIFRFKALGLQEVLIEDEAYMEFVLCFLAPTSLKKSITKFLW